MTILDTFVLLFTSDTTNLKKGQGDAEKATRDLEDRIKRTNAATQDLGISFLDMAKQAAAAIGVVTGVGAAVNGIFKAEDQAASAGLFADRMGLAVETVDEFSQAGIRFGGTAEAMQGDLKKIQDGLAGIRPFGGVGGFVSVLTPFMAGLQSLGVASTNADGSLRTTKEIFGDIHKLFNTMPNNLSQKIGTDVLGFNGATISMLQQTDDEYQKMMKHIAEMGVLTKGDTERAIELNQTWSDAEQIIRHFYLVAGKFIIEFFEKLPDLLKENKEEVNAFVATVKIAASALALALAPLIGELVIAQLPLLAIVAGFVALYAIIYKLGLATAINDWFSTIGDTVDSVISKIEKLILTIGKLLGISSSKSVGDTSANGPSYSSADHMVAARQAIAASMGLPISSQTSNSITNAGRSSKSSVSVDTINVHTQATDAKGISQSIGEAMRSHFSQTIMQTADGVLG